MLEEHITGTKLIKNKNMKASTKKKKQLPQLLLGITPQNTKKNSKQDIKST